MELRSHLMDGIMNNQLESLTTAIYKRAPHGDIVAFVSSILELVLSENSLVVNNWHPLGFLQLKLGHTDSNVSVKLHVWPKMLRYPQKPSWLIHRHEWHLDSHMLYGKIKNEIYNVSRVENQEEGTNKLYRVAFEGSSSILKDTGKMVRCVLHSSTEYEAGQGYSVPVQSFHASMVPKAYLASTLVLTQP